MDSQIFLITIVILGFLGILFSINRKLNELSEKQKPSEDLIEIIKLLREGSKEDRKILLENLQKNTDSLNKRLDNAATIIGNLQRNVGELSAIGESMKGIQELLASPKLRGGLGEQGLKILLEQSLPKQSFNLQYRYRSGVIVDAAIKTESGTIPIDSKFTIDNFKKMMNVKEEKDRETYRKLFIKDVKNRIDEISKNYISEDEETTDYALMYVPSESVYYEIIQSDSDLMSYAYKRRVLPVSPSTFYAFLRSVMLSFEGQKIASEIKNIQQALRSIHTETSKFSELLSTLQSHINNAYSMMNRVATQFVSLSSKVENVQSVRLPKNSDKMEKLGKLERGGEK